MRLPSPAALARRLVFALILLLAAVALRWNYAHQGGGFLTDDGFQYMNAATSFSRGSCLCTNLAHFDEQIAPGRMPVPFTHFAPGYPLLIAALMRLGGSSLPVETAALILPAVGYLLSLALLWSLALVLGATRPIAAGACLLWIVHSSALFYASATSTEPLFTALLLLTALGIAIDLRAASPRPQILVLIGAAAAISYWIRYPGLFVIAVAGAYIIWRAWTTRTLLWPAIALFSTASLTSAVMLRNLLLAGSWRGGFANMRSHETLASALKGSAKAGYHLVFGDRVKVQLLDPWMILFAAGVALLLWLGLREVRGISAPFAWMAAVAGVYAAATIYASTQTIASAFARYYLPLYPLVLAVAAALASRIPRSLIRDVALAGLAIAILGAQSRDLRAPAPVAPYLAVRDALLSDSPNVHDWILRSTEPQDVLFAENGQAVHYVLGGERPVVSIPAPDYTNRKDDEAGLHQLMDRFGARYLVLFPGQEPPEGEPQNPFLRDLATGRQPLPDWLRPAVKARNVLVLVRN